ncbi:hypothetical protein HHI36_015131 [Cryptolaemus montrouzieri]|uniref:Uncharacterized protein n=1 Tax=Cryptolaemus montrouzieri TaxID=559131 RepID=A0ABD2N5V9_9CUCU
MSNSFVIQDCLRSKTLELMNLNLKNDTPMSDEVRKSLAEIEICKNLIKEKIKKQEQRETFEDIENKLSNLQHDISDFDGLATDKTYSYLNESLNELEAKLCRIPETEDTQGKNLELSLQINFSKNRLREVAEDSENILVVENRIKELLQIFSEGKPDIDFNSLDEEFIKLRIDLDKLGITERLSYRKLTCVSYIEYLMKQMSERNKAKIGHVSRSVIV